MKYEVEEIGENQKLFCRIHIVNIDEEEVGNLRIRPVAFNPKPEGISTELSVNWEKYSTPLITKEQAKVPCKNGVVSFNSTVVKSSPLDLNVKHKPTHNKAHSVIFDVLSAKNDPEIRLLLRDNCCWEILI